MGRGKRRGTAARATALPLQSAQAPASLRQVEACGHFHLDRLPIERSSLLESVGYDPVEQLLEAEFHDGGIYLYRGVPQEVYDDIFEAPSVGYYFKHQIIDGGYDHEALHRSEYKETPEYLQFVKRSLNVDYVNEQEQLEQMRDYLLALPPTAISIDFETAIDSYSDKTRGCLRLVQLGIEAPTGEWFLDKNGKKRKGRQWVIDCFRVDPTPVIDVFQSDHEKLIHYLFFEQDWATGRFGAPIKNIFDSCLAWRGVQAYLTNTLRAADYAWRGENVPRSIRRVIGCTVTRREYLDRWRDGQGFMISDDDGYEYEGFDELLAQDLEKRPEVPTVVDEETGQVLESRPMTDPEYEAWLDEEVPALRHITEEENDRVQQRVLPFVAEKLTKAGFQTEPLTAHEVIARLQVPLGVSDDELPSSASQAAEGLATAAAQLRAAPLPKLNDIARMEREEFRELDEAIAEVERDVEPLKGKARQAGLTQLQALAALREELLVDWDERKLKLQEENLEIMAERARIKAQIAATPFVVPLDLDGSGQRRWCAFPDFDHTKRSATAFHPNTLAFLSQKLCKFDMPKTEQAGYWGRPTLTPSQITYAALDVAVLPRVVKDTKKVVHDLGIEKDVYIRRIGGSEQRVAERVSGKMERGEFVDHAEKAEVSLRRAVDLDELDDAWHSLRQMALYAPSYQRLAGLYEARQQELKPQASKRRRRTSASADAPF